jgi:transcriptional regulator with XRE-family HTH domain
MRAYLTVQELAKRAGVSSDTIWRIQKGERPKPSTIWKIVSVLKVHPDQVAEFAHADRAHADRDMASIGNGTTGGDFYGSHTLESLAEEQGVRRVENASDLLGDFWPENESMADFTSTIRDWRQHGTNNTRGKEL